MINNDNLHIKFCQRLLCYTVIFHYYNEKYNIQQSRRFYVIDPCVVFYDRFVFVEEMKTYKLKAKV